MNATHDNSTKDASQENIDVGTWIRFIREWKLPKIFESLPDSRQKSHATYSISTLAMWAFSACSFRQPSKNAMQTSLEELSFDSSKGILQLLGSQKIPYSSTVDEVLAKVDYEHFNLILLRLFDSLNERHFFYNHLELIPNNVFYIGGDGFQVHHYTVPHAVDENGRNRCPYCLPRRHNVGTPKEFTSWVHICVTFTLICEGMTLPLYVYPLKAAQVNTNQSDADLKQECELLATKTILALLRARYPRTSFVFLGDALYANRPFIKFLCSINFGYIIVLKENSLKTLHSRCDKLAKTEIYQKSYTHQETVYIGENTFHREAAWFNHTEVGEDIYTNVLRFKEEIRRNDVKFDAYKGIWICSEKISKSTCFKRAARGRSRWDQEDLHNSCKNRGFDARHDMARADPNLLWVWKLLLFIAFFIFEIFQYTTIAAKARKKRSLMKFAQDMLWQLIYIAWEVIALSPILQKPRVQFRFNFGCGP